MSNEVATRNNNELATIQAWGAAEEISSEDISIPRLSLTQALSEFVGKNNCKPGDWVESIDDRPLAKPVPVVIFDLKKFLVTRENGGKRVFGKVPLDINSMALPEEDVINGVSVIRVKQLEFYCFLADEPEMPYVLAFSRTGMPAAKTLATRFAKMRAANLPSAAVVVGLDSKQDSGPRGSWWAPVVSFLGDSSPELIAQAHKLYTQFRNIATHSEDVAPVAQPVQPAQARSQFVIEEQPPHPADAAPVAPKQWVKRY